MVISKTLFATVGEGGKVEFTLSEAEVGERVQVTVEPRKALKHPERFGFAPGFVISVGPDFDKPYDVG